jgi:hypothetical protein
MSSSDTEPLHTKSFPIQNVWEYMNYAADTALETYKLISSSTQHANLILKCYRLCFVPNKGPRNKNPSLYIGIL